LAPAMAGRPGLRRPLDLARPVPQPPPMARRLGPPNARPHRLDRGHPLPLVPRLAPGRRADPVGTTPNRPLRRLPRLRRLCRDRQLLRLGGAVRGGTTASAGAISL